LGIHANEAHFVDFLGHGLNGSVYGKRAKVDAFSIGSFTLENANVAFPDSTSISFAKNHKDRNGSLAGNILKRFHVVFDYERSTLQLKKSKYFKDPFSYNKSGIELEQNGIRLIRERSFGGLKRTKTDNVNSINNTSGIRFTYDNDYKLSVKPSYTIVELRADSPAERAGLKVGDIILKINGKETSDFSLQNITQYFYEKDGKTIKLQVNRLGKEFNFEFALEGMF